MVDVLMIAGGLALLFFGGEGLIKGAVCMARRFGLSQLLVSAVIVGFGTSMPEMTVSISAALKGSSDIAMGNVVGSNTANILLILGLASVIYPLTVPAATVRRDTLMMIASSLLLCGLALLGVISPLAGALMFAGLIGYIAWSYRLDKQMQSERAAHLADDVEHKHLPLKTALVYTIGGLILLVAGAYAMVEGAVSLARGFGIPEAVIGLTVVAVGTSLPELATSIIAARHRHGDVIIGNIVGSNIFNILAILGVTAVISPISVAPKFASQDVWIMLGVTVLLSVYLLKGKTIGRVSGAAMLMVYAGYTLWLYLQQ